MNKNIRISLLYFSLLCTIANAQVKDAGLWLSIAAEKKLTSSFDIGINQEFRFNENITELGTAFTEIGAGFKLVKNLSFSANYRFGQSRRKDDFYGLRHRYYFDLSYKIKMNKIHLIMRGRLQSQYKEVNASDDGRMPGNYLRSKFTLKYNTDKKYTPFAAIEFFNWLNDPEGNAALNNIRYQFGFDYEVNKFNSFSVAYLINQEVNVNNPWTSYIVSLGYKYSF